MKKRIKGYIGATAFSLLSVFSSYYLIYPAINIHSFGFWFYLFVMALLVGGAFWLASYLCPKDAEVVKDNATFRENFSKLPFITKLCTFIVIFTFAFPLLALIWGAPMFHAKEYASLMPIEEATFSENVEQTKNVKDIALMDTESARLVGNRKLGALSDLVSQYEVDEEYNQICINGAPFKVSPLKYASFFKTLKNQSKGVPGYIQVDPVKFTASYVTLKENLKYTSAAYFNYNLQRHVQFQYPTKLVSGYYFEIDDEGRPFYVCPTRTSRISLFGALDVEGVILCDPVSGECTYYNKDEIPNWVDRVYDGVLIAKKYNWFGMYANGFWNSLFSQTGCKQTTDDYGYKVMDNDVWIYTGITSVTGDESNIGFIMVNQRTCKTYYYPVSGAEEYSAMAAAEGEVQEKGYVASFPSLINVEGSPTYIMVLKDNGGLVKMYAMVNVEQYQIVATGTREEEVFLAYKKLLKNQTSSQEALGSCTEEITISDIQFVTIEGSTTVYLKDEKKQVYKQNFAENEALIKLNPGDTITVTYEKMESGIHHLSDFEFTNSNNNATIPSVKNVSDSAIESNMDVEQ